MSHTLTIENPCHGVRAVHAHHDSDWTGVVSLDWDEDGEEHRARVPGAVFLAVSRAAALAVVRDTVVAALEDLAPDAVGKSETDPDPRIRTWSADTLIRAMTKERTPYVSDPLAQSAPRQLKIDNVSEEDILKIEALFAYDRNTTPRLSRFVLALCWTLRDAKREIERLRAAAGAP